MFGFHSRCRDIESILVGRIKDLEAERDQQSERLVQLVEAYGQREKMLVDRVIALTNPLAGRAIASIEPARPMPGVARGAGQRPRAVMPGSAPRLTPNQTGFRPQPQPVEETEPEPPWVAATGAPVPPTTPVPSDTDDRADTISDFLAKDRNLRTER